MEETDSDSDSRIIDLTADTMSSVAEFIDLSKDPEVIDLCSSDNSSTTSSDLLRSNHSKLMPHSVLQDTSDTSIDLHSGTGGKAGLAHPQLIGTLGRFNKLEKNVKKQLEHHMEELTSVPFFLGEHCLL